MAGEVWSCPSCGLYLEGKHDECPRCGIVLSKYSSQGAEEPSAVEPPAEQSSLRVPLRATKNPRPTDKLDSKKSIVSTITIIAIFVFILAGMIRLFVPKPSTQTYVPPPASKSSVKTRTVNRDWYATRTQGDVDKVLGFILKRDEATLTRLATQGQIRLFQDGTAVEIISQVMNDAEIREQGDTSTWWVPLRIVED